MSITAWNDDFGPLLPKEEQPAPVDFPSSANTESFIVLKQYRFHKQLCIELYAAPITRDGKIKNPLTLINPLDLLWKTADIHETKFFSAVARFQNNPTAAKSAADFDALKSVLNNPRALRFFYHNTECSDNIVAGSIRPVTAGSIIHDLSLQVNKQDAFYTVSLQVTIGGKTYRWNELQVLYDYFILVDDTLYLIGNIHFMNVIRFFRQKQTDLRIHETKFKTFQQHILAKLEDKISICYTYITAATAEQAAQNEQSQPAEKLIYLSDHAHYVIINPVMKYGMVEIPVRTKRQIYSTDAHGNTCLFSRNDEEEIRFTALLLKQHPDFLEQLDNDLPHFYLHKERFLQEDWFLEAFSTWANQGITVLGFNQLKGNKLNGNKPKVTIHVKSGLNWFNTDIQVRFGRKQASLIQLQRSVRNKSKFVHLDDGTLGILPEAWLEKMAGFFNAGEIVNDILVTPKINFSAVAQLYEAEMLDEAVKKELDLYRAKFETFDSITEIKPPAELQASLREYQQQGLNWLNFLDDYNFGGCLADDMGLGKSIQIIAFILSQRQKVKQNTNLLVVPTSLIFNWQAEVQQFAPSLKICTLYNADRPRDTSLFDDHEIILTSYGTLISDITFLRHYVFNYIFLDESQNIKNIESQRYQAVRLLRSRNKIAITGTPVENNTLDLYGQLSFACPGLLGSKQYFKNIYSIPIDKFKDSRRAVELQQKVAPFILRRTKQQVASELPEKTEMICYCPMDVAQRKVYDAHEKELRDFIAGVRNEELTKNSMHVLRGLTRLRQICNSPVLLKDEALYGDGSSKLDMLMEQIENKSSHHKILIFSQFVAMLNLVKKELETRNIRHEYLTGGTRDRKSAVKNFQQDPGIRVFLISLKAGGTGLNLTEADYVYIVDPWWNPAVENQAIDRSHRIGQGKNVVAVRLICPDTVEEKIMKLQEFKKELSNDLVKTDHAVLKSITKNELLSLLGYDGSS